MHGRRVSRGRIARHVQLAAASSESVGSFVSRNAQLAHAMPATLDS